MAKAKTAAKTEKAEASTKREDWQQRVIDEQTDLGEKMQKLEAFIAGDKFAGVHHLEQGRLKDQLDAMRTYSRILGERIRAF